VTGGDGSLGDIRKALAGITERLDALADAVAVASGAAPPGALLDEPTRAQLASLHGLLAVGRGTTPDEACLLAIDRALTHARADCAAILRLDRDRGAIVLAERGFRLPLEVRSDEGIVGRAVGFDEVVQGGLGLGGPDALLERHGLGAALVVPVPDHAGLTLGAFLVGRRRPVPFEPDAIGALTVAAARLGERLETRPADTREETVPTALFESLDPSRTAAAVASAAAARLGADAAAVVWSDGEEFVLAGGVGLPEGATAPAGSPMISAVAEMRETVVASAGFPPDAELARCLGTLPRAALPLTVDDRQIAVLLLGSAHPCDTALSPAFTRAAAVALRNARLHAESRRVAGESPADAETPPTTTAEAGAAPLGDMASLLAVVLGRLAAARDRVGDHEAARDLVHAEEAAWRVAEGIRRVLGFAPRPGAQAPSPVDIGVAVRESVRATERLWASEGAVPEVTLDLEPVPPVRVHPDELRHAVHHLLQNAREAGDSTAAVSIGLHWNGATHVELSVADRGRGMDESTRARAEEPFFTTKGAGRLGVGLAVVRAMASRHKGELEIESAPGEGTTVRLRLPTAARARAGGLHAGTASAGQRRILLVDDDRIVRETLTQGLEREGHLVLAARDVGEAVALLGREPVDLVITDLVLPGGSGLEVARTAKRARGTLPVILITGWPGRVEPQTLADHGIDALVEKPVGLDTLRATVVSLLGRASARPR
jgi:signal transduction histidine kinase/ActR/RegA family two-component response regulator